MRQKCITDIQLSAFQNCSMLFTVSLLANQHVQIKLNIKSCFFLKWNYLLTFSRNCTLIRPEEKFMS